MSHNFKYEIVLEATTYNENPFNLGPNDINAILYNGISNGSISIKFISAKEFSLDYFYNIFCDTCPNVKFQGDFTIKEMIRVTEGGHLGHKIRIVTLQK